MLKHTYQTIRRRARDLYLKALIQSGQRLGSPVSFHTQRDQITGLTDYTELAPAQTVTVTGTPARDFLRRQETAPHRDDTFAPRAMFVCTLENARFDTHDGTLWTADYRLLLESAAGDWRYRNSKPYGHYPPPASTVPLLPGAYSSIWGMYAGNYFHWMVEALPRLYALHATASEPITLLMPANLSPLQRETLDLCLPANVTVQSLDDRPWLQPERFIFPSMVVTRNNMPYPPPEYVAYIRERLITGYGLPGDEPAQDLNLYVSRQKAFKRRVLNEDALLARLERYHFEPVVLEDLPLSEQITLFRRAKHIVGVHGASNANLMFGGAGVKLLEMHSGMLKTSGFFMTLSRGYTYYYVLPDRIEDNPYSRTKRGHRRLRDVDFSVDLDTFERTLAQMMAASP